MVRGGVVLVAAAVAVFLLLWLLWPKGDDETAARIERRAGLDLVAACNRAAAPLGLRFEAADVRRSAAEAAEGVVALASVLEARHGGVVCRWNGVDPASITGE